MTYLIAIIAGIVGATIGYFVFGITAAAVGEFAGMSSFEGGLGMFAFLFVGPIGGLIGLISGVWLTFRWRGHTSLKAVGWRIPVTLAMIAALTSGGLWIAYEMRPQLATSSSAAPRLDFEIRLPAGMTVPSPRSRIRVDLNTERNQQPGLIFEEGRMDGDRPVLIGSVELYYRSSWRLLELVPVEGGSSYVFDLRLAARPSHMPNYGQWAHVDFVSTRGTEQPRKSTEADAYDIRARVVYRDSENETQSGQILE